MPSAICNTCNQFVLYSSRHGHRIKDKVCTCGSNDLSAVSGHWNNEKQGWDYTDRKGNHRIFVAVDLNQIKQTA